MTERTKAKDGQHEESILKGVECHFLASSGTISKQEKILAVADSICACSFWWLDCAQSRISRFALHLRPFLRRKAMTTILGISAYYHDSSASLLQNEIVAAAQETVTRKKHDASYLAMPLITVLAKSNTLGEVDHIVFYEKPFLKFERLLETYVAFAPRGVSRLKQQSYLVARKLFQKDMMIGEFKKQDLDFKDQGQLKFSEHHFSHAASAFYPSPFEEAVVLTLDGVGEWATTTVAIGQGRELKIKKEIQFPHSLGISIPRLPIIPVFGSILVSTRLWARLRHTKI